ncbi:thiamine pyrophosphate-binding protein [Streptomyces violascens]|uniref:thiamine pyrophosphate-binding protein n=1 Tax=Streptomyces violascens TaxID=67381 RepID=UPI00365EC541
MRIADAIVTALRELDTRYVFGVSGANVEHLHDSIERLGQGRLSAVLTKREDGAAFMADARARIHRTLGVCCSTSGGGMMNLVPGLAESHAESVPVLAVVGQTPTTLDGRGSFQDSSGIGRTIDALSLLRSVTKKTVRITGPEGFWEIFRDAMETALSGRKGPVALLIPRNCYDLEVGAPPADWPKSLDELTRTEPVDDTAVRQLFRRLRDATAPVLLLGHGVRRSTDPDAVRRFALRAKIPVVTTMGARGEFPNEDPLYLGVVGAGGHPSAATYIEKSDLVVPVGTGLAMMTRGPVSGLAPDRVVAVNIDPGELQRAELADTVVQGDAGVVFERLLDLLDQEPFTLPAAADYELRRFVPRLAEPVPGRQLPSRTGLLQSEAVRILQDHLPSDGHVLYDAGNCAVASMHYSFVPPGSSSTIALGMGGMGYSIGAAIGAQLGTPEGTRTVVMCGDGAFLMSGLEVHTAVELGLPILYVVFNNGMHGMCATRQQTFFDSRITAVQYTPVDARSVASGLGTPDRLWIGSAETPAELAEQLDQYGRRSHLPGVLELRIDTEEVPPFAGFLPADEPTTVVPTPWRFKAPLDCGAVTSV